MNMRKRFHSGAAAAIAMGVAMALMSLTAVPAAGQAAKNPVNKSSDAKSAIPRLPYGHPDLQGTYDLATMTPFERLPGDPPFLSKEQAEKLQSAEMARRSVD